MITCADTHECLKMHAEVERLRAEFRRFMAVCGEGTRLGRAIDFIDKADWERARRALHNHEGVQHD